LEAVVKQPKIALAMIVKYSEAGLLKDCLESITDHVDNIFLYINYADSPKQAEEAVAVAKHFNADYTVQKWTNFGDARNRSFAMVPKDYNFIIWLDTDDTVDNPEKLHQVALATPKHVSGVYMAYDYQHDAFGNVTVQHYVARMIRNDGTFKWSDKILHESLEPVRHCGKAMNDEVRVIHHADMERRDASLVRNIEMLEKEMKGEGSTPDPRTLFYLGSAYIDAHCTDEAKMLLKRYLELSGWAEERAQAWVHLGNIFDSEDDVEEARGCYIHALAENPKDPNPLVELAKLEMLGGMWEKAIEWLDMALAKKNDPMTTVNFGTETKYRAYMYLSDCYMSQGGQSIEKALEYAEKALEMRPDDVTQNYYDQVQEVIAQRDMAKGVVLALRELEKQKAITQSLTLIDSLPKSLQDNPLILRYKKRHSKPKVWKKNSAVIFTGNSVIGEWGPDVLEQGVGGSEEAVIRLSRQLKQQGYEVWVYGNPGLKTGDYDGVQWRNYWELNLADEFDVFIGWRMPWFFDIKINARKKYLWLHDVMDKEEFTKERLDNLDKVIVLSKYHRTLFPMIPDEKIFLSANGIDPEDFEKTDGKFKRDPHSIVYMSSHVRGLQLLYHVWPDVLKEVPDAQLKIFYGWSSYDAVNKGNPERMAWKQKMIDWEAELDNVHDYGKISQAQIVEEIQKAGVWAYPCPFPEISCISAMKAQAGGAIPVSSNFAALEETVQWGTKLKMKELNPKTPVGEWDDKELTAFKNALVSTLKDQDEAERQKMMAWSRTNQSWAVVASQWIKEWES
jgi:tetratricopeptide (TPR) repeat protein